MKQIILISLISSAICFFSCQPSNKESNSTFSFDRYLGNYVDQDYSKRAEGYDWVVVTLDTIGKNKYQILVRSRSDKKKPTCQYTSEVFPLNDTTLKSEFQGKVLLFSFSGEKLRIRTEKDEDESILYYFCSGGASMAGTYTKISEPLDESQLATFNYLKSLALQGISFNIKATNSGSINQLIIEPSGLKISNRLVHHEIDGMVTNVDIDDLNKDGSPEILVYYTSAGSGAYGSVIAYSVNYKKSMSQIYFPGISNSAKASEGYMGHDEFAVVETKLVQRFPIYRKDDTNSQPTGGMRQIQYKLVEGEASRIFKIDRIVEYPID